MSSIQKFLSLTVTINAMVEGYPFYEDRTCLLLGIDPIFNDGTGRTEFSGYKTCIYDNNLPVDGSCYKCDIHNRLTPDEIENKLSKKPTDL